jgi:hypothetical protein
MSLTVRPVDVNHIQQVWPMVEGYIQESMDKGGDFPAWADGYNLSHIQTFVTSGQWLLLVAVDEERVIHGATTVSFLNYPLHRVAFVTSTGGKFIANPELLEQLKALVKAHGATKIQAFCRESMVRLLSRAGFEPRNTLIEVLV